jgi:hypothetical protein
LLAIARKSWVRMQGAYDTRHESDRPFVHGHVAMLAFTVRSLPALARTP